MATDFSQLGLDPDQVRIELQALGIDDSIYTDEQLESLALAANLVLLQAIANKSTSVEENLAAYQIEVDITSAMQETLNDLRDFISPTEADGQDLVDFAQSTQTYMDISDASLVELDYTFSGTTYETLQDLLTALDDPNHTLLDDFILSQVVGLGGSPLGGSTLVDATTLLPILADQDGLDAFASGQAYLSDAQAPHLTYRINLDHNDAKNYLIAQALQSAGYLGDDVYTELRQFSTVNQPSPTFNDYLQLIKLYFGETSIEYDSSEGTMTLDMSGFAGLRQMGIEAGRYFEERANPGITVYPFNTDATEDNLLFLLNNYAFNGNGTTWSDHSNRELTNYIKEKDIDVLLQASATSIEAQSTTTEVALLKVNSGISEWGELNDVWDLVHQYIQDSLKKASDNTI